MNGVILGLFSLQQFALKIHPLYHAIQKQFQSQKQDCLRSERIVGE